MDSKCKHCKCDIHYDEGMQAYADNNGYTYCYAEGNWAGYHKP